MAVLTNRGILISALEEYESPTSNDLLVIQDITKNKTKKINLTNLATGLFASATGASNFKNVKNKFTGSFYVPSDTGGGTPGTLTSYGRTKLGMSPSGNPSLDVYYNASVGNQAYFRTNLFSVTTNDCELSVTNTFYLSAADTIVIGPTYFQDPLTASYGRIDNLISTVTGNFFGNLYGDVYSKTTGIKILDSNNIRFFGTSSYATDAKSASYAKVADMTYTCVSHTTDADTATSASYALQASHANTSSYLRYTGANNGTASFAQRTALALTANNVINVPSTSSYSLRSKTSSYVDTLDVANSSLGTVAYFDGTKYIGTKDFNRISNGTGLGNYQIVALSSSRYLNALVISSRGHPTYGNQAGISFYNLNNSKSYPNISGYTVGSYYSGSLTFIAPLGSAEFSSSTRVAVGSAAETYTFVSKRSGYYFWPYMAVNTPSREGSIGIGVQPPGSADTDPYLLGKLHIRCFSSSKAHVGKVTGQTLTGTVKLPQYAIYVDYGSSSYNPLFSVGASGSNAGDTYVAGDLTVDGVINGTFGYGPATPNAFGVRWPLGGITYGNYIFYTQVKANNILSILRLNQVTNEVTLVDTLPSNTYGGHMSLHKFNANNTGVKDTIVFADGNGGVNIIYDLTSSPPSTHRYTSHGDNGLRLYKCLYVNQTPTTFDPHAGPTTPTFYMMSDSFNAAVGAQAITLWKIYHNGTQYTSANMGYYLNVLSNTNIGNTANLQAINGITDYRILTSIYNPIKGRLYLVGNSSGICDIYQISTAYTSVYGFNIGEWWQSGSVSLSTRDSQLSYVKSITIPQQGSNYWTNAEWEGYGLEYNTTTGAEKFWSWNRVGNNLLTGIVGKSPWYGS